MGKLIELNVHQIIYSIIIVYTVVTVNIMILINYFENNSNSFLVSFYVIVLTGIYTYSVYIENV